MHVYGDETLYAAVVDGSAHMAPAASWGRAAGNGVPRPVRHGPGRMSDEQRGRRSGRRGFAPERRRRPGSRRTRTEWTDLHFAAVLNRAGPGAAATGGRGPGGRPAARRKRVLSEALRAALAACGQDRFDAWRPTGCTPLHLAVMAEAREVVDGAAPPRGGPACAGGRRSAAGARGGAQERPRGARRAARLRGRRRGARRERSDAAPWAAYGGAGDAAAVLVERGALRRRAARGALHNDERRLQRDAREGAPEGRRYDGAPPPRHPRRVRPGTERPRPSGRGRPGRGTGGTHLYVMTTAEQRHRWKLPDLAAFGGAPAVDDPRGARPAPRAHHLARGHGRARRAAGPQLGARGPPRARHPHKRASTGHSESWDHGDGDVRMTEWRSERLVPPRWIASAARLGR